MRTKAFTLVELMIAMALATVLCVAAYATVRMCTQAVATVNRLSLENNLMRTGLLTALDELDSWKSYDDPDKPNAERPLHDQYHPFYPLDFAASGFDTDFDQSDPKCWYRGPSQMIRTGKKYGDTALFAMQNYVDLDDPQRQKERRWTANTLGTISNKLGYYALFDYLPSGMILMYTGSDEKSAPEFSIFYGPTVYKGATPIKPVITSSSGQNTPYDALANRGGGYTITTDAEYLARDVDHHYFQGWLGILDTADAADWLAKHIRDDCGSKQPFLDKAPETWPTVEIKVNHTHYVGRMNDNASIILSSPVTAQKLKLYITATSTTLRGARRQRGLDLNEMP
jgi:prepilin-type N-terminal cleavage/methylation domain-containing protein